VHNSDDQDGEADEDGYGDGCAGNQRPDFPEGIHSWHNTVDLGTVGGRTEARQTRRIATWNVQNRYYEQGIASCLVKHAIDYVGIQEPNAFARKTPSRFENSNKEYMKQLGFLPHYQPMQNVLIDQETLGYVSRGDPLTFEKGRVIVTHFDTLDTKVLTIITCYGVAKGNSVYNDGVSKTVLRTAVQNCVCEQAAKTKGEHQDRYLIVMGDLQEEFDGRFLKRLQAAPLGMCSPHMEALRRQSDREGTPIATPRGFPTRFPIRNATTGQYIGRPSAIDWILVCKETRPFATKVGVSHAVMEFIHSDRYKSEYRTPIRTDYDHSIFHEKDY
jgi:hypothetical protein